MVQKIRLEDPESDIVHSPITQVTGWCTADSAETPLQMWVNDKLVSPAIVERPDVRRVFPGVPSFGFSHWLSPKDCVSAQGGEVELRFTLGVLSTERKLRFSDAAIDAASAWERTRAAKGAWCMKVIRCPSCRTGSLEQRAGNALHCTGCERVLEQDTGALNLLPAELYDRFQLKPTESVSSHAYAPAIKELIEEVRRAGGKVLDCGAGLRANQDETIINMEIVDYPSTDVLAVGQSLPFADASFDLVLSLAVLEHVDDPFACAAELVRVLKPGGKLFCVVPFLQPEHGYPNHFFNMTRQGLAKLFAGKARILSHEVPQYGAPVYSLCWFLNEYLAGLPDEARSQLEAMTVGDIARLKKDDYWKQPFVQQLSPEGNWRLASVTAALLVRDP